jgi:hypothetical protein
MGRVQRIGALVKERMQELADLSEDEVLVAVLESLRDGPLKQPVSWDGIFETKPPGGQRPISFSFPTTT